MSPGLLSLTSYVVPPSLTPDALSAALTVALKSSPTLILRGLLEKRLFPSAAGVGAKLLSLLLLERFFLLSAPYRAAVAASSLFSSSPLGKVCSILSDLSLLCLFSSPEESDAQASAPWLFHVPPSPAPSAKKGGKPTKRKSGAESRLSSQVAKAQRRALRFFPRDALPAHLRLCGQAAARCLFAGVSVSGADPPQVVKKFRSAVSHVRSVGLSFVKFASPRASSSPLFSPSALLAPVPFTLEELREAVSIDEPLLAATLLLQQVDQGWLEPLSDLASLGEQSLPSAERALLAADRDTLGGAGRSEDGRGDQPVTVESSIGREREDDYGEDGCRVDTTNFLPSDLDDFFANRDPSFSSVDVSPLSTSLAPSSPVAFPAPQEQRKSRQADTPSTRLLQASPSAGPEAAPASVLVFEGDADRLSSGSLSLSHVSSVSSSCSRARHGLESGETPAQALGVADDARDACGRAAWVPVHVPLTAAASQRPESGSEPASTLLCLSTAGLEGGETRRDPGAGDRKGGDPEPVEAESLATFVGGPGRGAHADYSQESTLSAAPDFRTDETMGVFKKHSKKTPPAAKSAATPPQPARPRQSPGAPGTRASTRAADAGSDCSDDKKTLEEVLSGALSAAEFLQEMVRQEDAQLETSDFGTAAERALDECTSMLAGCASVCGKKQARLQEEAAKAVDDGRMDDFATISKVMDQLSFALEAYEGGKRRLELWRRESDELQQVEREAKSSKDPLDPAPTESPVAAVGRTDSPDSSVAFPSQSPWDVASPAISRSEPRSAFSMPVGDDAESGGEEEEAVLKPAKPAPSRPAPAYAPLELVQDNCWRKTEKESERQSEPAGLSASSGVGEKEQKEDARRGEAKSAAEGPLAAAFDRAATSLARDETGKKEKKEKKKEKPVEKKPSRSRDGEKSDDAASVGSGTQRRRKKEGREEGRRRQETSESVPASSAAKTEAETRKAAAPAAAAPHVSPASLPSVASFAQIPVGWPETTTDTGDAEADFAALPGDPDESEAFLTPFQRTRSFFEKQAKKNARAEASRPPFNSGRLSGEAKQRPGKETLSERKQEPFEWNAEGFGFESFEDDNSLWEERVGAGRGESAPLLSTWNASSLFTVQEEDRSEVEGEDARSAVASAEPQTAPPLPAPREKKGKRDETEKERRRRGESGGGEMPSRREKSRRNGEADSFFSAAGAPDAPKEKRRRDRGGREATPSPFDSAQAAGPRGEDLLVGSGGDAVRREETGDASDGSAEGFDWIRAASYPVLPSQPSSPCQVGQGRNAMEGRSRGGEREHQAASSITTLDERRRSSSGSSPSSRGRRRRQVLPSGAHQAAEEGDETHSRAPPRLQPGLASKPGRHGRDSSPPSGSRPSRRSPTRAASALSPRLSSYPPCPFTGSSAFARSHSEMRPFPRNGEVTSTFEDFEFFTTACSDQDLSGDSPSFPAHFPAVSGSAVGLSALSRDSVGAARRKPRDRRSGGEPGDSLLAPERRPREKPGRGAAVWGDLPAPATGETGPATSGLHSRGASAIPPEGDSGFAQERGSAGWERARRSIEDGKGATGPAGLEAEESGRREEDASRFEEKVKHLEEKIDRLQRRENEHFAALERERREAENLRRAMKDSLERKAREWEEERNDFLKKEDEHVAKVQSLSGRLVEADAEAKKRREENERLKNNLQQKCAALENAKDMWLRESARASALSDRLDEAEEKIADLETKLASLSAKYAESLREIEAFKVLVDPRGSSSNSSRGGLHASPSVACSPAASGFFPSGRASPFPSEASRSSRKSLKPESALPSALELRAGVSVSAAQASQRGEGERRGADFSLARDGAWKSDEVPREPDGRFVSAQELWGREDAGRNGRRQGMAEVVQVVNGFGDDNMLGDASNPPPFSFYSGPPEAARTAGAPQSFSLSTLSVASIGSRHGSVASRREREDARAHAGMVLVSDNLRRLLLVDDALLFEDDTIQIGIKSAYTGLTGRVSIYYGNKTSGLLQNFATSFLNPQAESLLLQTSAMPAILAPKQQICQEVALECFAPFDEWPSLRLDFLLADNTPRSVAVTLPIAVSKFTEGRDVGAEEFFVFWKNERFVLKETSCVVNLHPRFRGSLLTVAQASQLGRALSLCRKVDPNPENLVLAGAFPPSASDQAIPLSIVLVRLEMGRGRHHGKCRLVVRSDCHVLSRGIRDLISLQIATPQPAALPLSSS
ncbi:conserved hypothetical protein [Neospora caninum Liverpool]|uniref:Clathrin adaptor alpha/beta/gamma-adaptin appendage Ig-like subdomain domain-containing protein n=1 Tax=Neospora caninum (strain Liverpool) TaxID=572307 RepID=F0VIX7_NEOCL|nr:conserved hypothetical protein [Neospora caninum Liverpool]CBZ53688.1 conserved hypothetical protein [Neospora caninum Liverpool]|eukprot:XP_003883720.1 conserved hypothetical protein [Neospora caninum Liverpool]